MNPLQMLVQQMAVEFFFTALVAIILITFIVIIINELKGGFL